MVYSNLFSGLGVFLSGLGAGMPHLTAAVTQHYDLKPHISSFPFHFPFLTVKHPVFHLGQLRNKRGLPFTFPDAVSR